jgi:hypothetical protein
MLENASTAVPPIRRSARLMEQKHDSIHQEPISVLYRIPIEIRLKIFELLLVSPDHLSFTRTWRLSSKRKRRSSHFRKYSWCDDISPVLRLCRWHETEDNEPIALALHTDFVNVCLVSKEMREEAMKIFFGCNKWVLHVSKEMNSIDWIVEKWGEERLRRIKVLRIELQSADFSHDWLVFKGLERFVSVIKEEAQLHTLSISWRHTYKYLKTGRYSGYIPHIPWLGPPSRHARNPAKTRELSSAPSDENSETEPTRSETSCAGWPEKEMVLMPLQKLRGMSASIEGEVTERWALWLEGCMRAKKGKDMGEFVGNGEEKEVAQMLKQATSSKEYFQMIVEADPDL